MAIEREHALLGASSAKRWLNCPFSVAASVGEPNKSSVAADEGTLCHELVELETRLKFLPDTLFPGSAERKREEIQANPLYKHDMVWCSQEALEFIDRLSYEYDSPPSVITESRVDFSRFVPEGYGYSDVILYGGNRIDVWDYKHGKGVAVNAYQNEQGSLYGLGAIEHVLVHHNQQFDKNCKVGIHICQPRNGGDSSWYTTAEELIDWGINTVKPIAVKAYSWATQSIEPDEGPKSGNWCTFCPVKYKCKACSQMAAVKAFGMKEAHMYTDAELSEILSLQSNVVGWFKKVEEHVKAQVDAGKSFPGWKLVAGRGKRTFTDTDKAIQRLQQHGYDRALFYETNPLTVAKMEGVVGKKAFNEIVGDMVQNTPGAPVIAPESDKREPLNGLAAALAAFT